MKRNLVSCTYDELPIDCTVDCIGRQQCSGQGGFTFQGSGELDFISQKTDSYCISFSK